MTSPKIDINRNELYGRRWKSARAAFLRSHPLCCECERRGMVVAAAVVDHVTPHKGDMALFWDSNNWQSLCKTCHSSWKQALEHGHARGVDDSGWPLDPGHHWKGEGHK
jgi:5-methylcytosine-specific restriction enzyme A